MALSGRAWGRQNRCRDPVPIMGCVVPRIAGMAIRVPELRARFMEHHVAAGTPLATQHRAASKPSPRWLFAAG